MKKITAEWLKGAQDDLRVMEKLLGDELLTHMVAFHAQQCLEKSLKAIIEEFEIGSVRIHHLVRLFEMAKDHLEIDLDPVLIEKLDKLYLDTRYPGELGLLPEGKPSIAESEEFYRTADRVNKAIMARLA
jgi:HEPN domain-containing protein